MTWHVYYRATGNSIYNLNRKQTMKRRNTQLGNNKLLSITAREEERKTGRGEEKKWEG